jgi:DNA polymerase III subunit beta
MKVILPRSALLSMIQKAQNIISSKPPSPILSNILLQATQGELIITANESLLSIQAKAHANVIEEGSIVLSPKKITPLIRELTAPEVEICVENSHIALISSGSSRFKIPAIGAEEYPVLPNLIDGFQVSFPTAVLKEMLSKSIFSAGNDETRPIFSSVLLHREQNQTTFMGTDGKRLSKVHTYIDLPPDWMGSYILPIKAAQEMIRLLDESEKTSYLYFFGEKISLQVGSVVLTSKLIGGQYPDVSRIIPEKTEKPVRVHREELMSLLRQVCLFTTEDQTSVRFTFSQGDLSLSIATGGSGEGHVSMPINYDGNPINVAFNPHYLLEILRHSQDEVVNLNVTDQHTPGLITDETSAIFAIMPMRLET